MPSPLLPESFDQQQPRRVFCFPHAGGGAAMFYRWQRFLPDDVALVPLRLPGREDRLKESPYVELNALADDIAQAVSLLPAAEAVFVGHSLGGYVAYEVARRLQAWWSKLPAKLIVAACGAPRVGKSQNPIGQLPDQEFLEQVAQRYDGLPAAVRESPELMAMVLPALRADIRMIESYEYQPADPLPIDLLALGAPDDPGVPVNRLNDWRKFTTRAFAMRLFPGGHFFLHPPARRDACSIAVPPAIQLVIDALPPGGVA